MSVEAPNPGTTGRSAAEIIQQINAKNAKIFAFILVIGFIIYHGMLHVRYGIDSCKWLLSDGRYKGDQEWQPYGCMMHQYTQLDTKRCLRYLAFLGKHNHIVFIGDSRIRQMYHEFLNNLNPQDGTTPSIHQERHANLSYLDLKLRLRVELIWSPYVSRHMIDEFLKWKKQEEPPSVIIAGSGTWTIKESNASLRALEDYKVNLTHLVHAIDALAVKKTRVLWTLQEPVNREKLHSSRSVITNNLIDQYNNAAKEILQHSAAKIWASSRLVAEGNLEESPDGLHLGLLTLKHDTQILLNMYCNDHMNFNDGTCCSSAEPYTTLQVVTFSFLGV